MVIVLNHSINQFRNDCRSTKIDDCVVTFLYNLTFWNDSKNWGANYCIEFQVVFSLEIAYNLCISKYRSMYEN